MKYIDRPLGCFVDRHESESDLEPVDVIMLTLDAENFVEKCLYTVYREVPVRKLLVCDGGSKDATIEMLKKFPRVEVHIRPDIRTTGKALEFLISLVDTKWFVMVDADIELSPGWYDGMLKVAGEYDVIESSKRVMAYHFYREDPAKLGAEARSFDLCHMAKKSAMQGYRCEDDYMWRYTDILLRQAAEKSNYKYGKVDSVFHVHNETERILYKSDEEKNFSKIAWSEPKVVILDKEKEALSRIKNAKAVVKYLDPRYPMVKNDKEYDQIIKLLDRKWISANGPAWLERYDRVTSTLFLLKKFIIIQIAGMRKRLR